MLDHKLKIFVSYGNMQNEFSRLNLCIQELQEKFDIYSLTVQAGRNVSLLRFGSNARVVEYCSPAEFEEFVRECDIFITHAGVGNLDLAIRYQKRPAIMPRRAKYNEHVDDHHVELLEHLRVFDFFDEFETASELDNLLLTNYYLKPMGLRVELTAEPRLIAEICHLVRKLSL
jgi:UDP-N-acetylglucosamine transferase subunit ALG13